MSYEPISLHELLLRYRVAARLSSSDAANVQQRDAQIEMLRGTQKYLYTEYAFPDLDLEVQYKGMAGQRYYDFTDIDLTQTARIEFKDGGVWVPLREGITAGEYTYIDSDLDSRSWPAQAWTVRNVSGTPQVEIWPLLDRDGDDTTKDGWFKVIGVKKLGVLAADADMTTLDGDLIAWQAAAEYLTSAKSNDAKLVTAKARSYTANLRGRKSKISQFSMKPRMGDERPERPFIRHYRP